MRKMIAFAVAVATVATPALAEEKCWTSKEMSAARVRDLQSVLMVSALQCRTSGHDVLPEYNRFVVAGRTTIVSQNDVLKARFTRVQGMKEGQRAYDSFTTALANAHAMTASSSAGFCTSMVALASEAADAAGGPQAADALELLAERVSERPAGVGEGCGEIGSKPTIASAAPAARGAAVAAQQVYMLVPASPPATGR